MVTALKAPAKKSSSIAATGYDPHTRTLAVQFHNTKGDKVYHYLDVPQETVDAMNGAESLGTFIGKHVVGKFEHRPPHAA